jgi:hypothetical protein
MRRAIVVGVLALLVPATALLPGPARAVPQVDAGPSDFNGDGFADLAIGVPGEDVNGQADAGAVTVLYGSGAGLQTGFDQLWTQDSPSIIDIAEAGDEFGAALATGDFDGDGRSDLAVGAPGQDVEEQFDAGAVAVLYGSARGLSPRDQAWSQNNQQIGGEAEAGDAFGTAVAAGDFDGDGFDDLAMGSPGEGVDPIAGVGAVNVLYGGSTGLGRSGNQFWAQDVPGVLDAGEPNDTFGYALSTGDLDGDGFADLAIGVLVEDVGEAADAGAVNVLYGGSDGLSTSGNQFWTQDSPDVVDDAEGSDFFGTDLSIADFDGDGFGDLAIGASQEDVGSISSAGAVNVLHGSPGGLSSAGNQFWTQDSVGIPDASETGDFFGQRITAGDLDGDGFGDLAIGAPFEDIVTIADAGAVNILHGTASGLSSTDTQLWTQDSPGLGGESETSDEFGMGLASADFDADGFDDLTIGVPNESLDVVLLAGSATTLYGTPSGLTADRDAFWAQDRPGILDQSEFGDRFGEALA